MDLLKLPGPVMMLISSIPEQAALMMYAPEMNLMDRLIVNAVMFGIHFAVNGVVPVAENTIGEAAWIVGTGAFSYFWGAPLVAVFAQVAFDAVFTLVMRGAVGV